MIQPGLEYDATPEVRLMLSQLGRTEDLQFSPDRRLLAIAAFGTDRIVVFKLHLETSAGSSAIRLTDYLQFTSPALSHPHGIVFFDEHTVAIANRTGKVSFFRIPPMGGNQKSFDLKPLYVLGGRLFNRIHSPGSLDTYKTGGNRYRLLICNNYAHVVTEAEVRSDGAFSVSRHRTLLRKGLEIPDGICVSANRQWIVVSNHVPGTLLVYKNAPDLGVSSEPVAELRGMVCPHGVRFVDRDRKIIVVDSADPTLCVYTGGVDGWHGTYQPDQVVRVLDDDTFQKGRYNLEEGGPKGIDIDEACGVLAMTCEHQPLTFYRLSDLLGAHVAPARGRSRDRVETVLAGDQPIGSPTP